nr:MFS transporter [Nocardioides sp. zg-DK7169]
MLVLAVAVFAAITTELLPVGLLPQIGTAFGVSDATAGLLVSAYAVMVAVLSVPLALATRRLPRKPVLLATLVGYLVSNAVSAAAPSFAVLAAGRVVGGVTHALFFSVCIGYAARLVPATRTGRAMALASVGISGGLVLGVPLTTALGDAFGWRAAFGVLAGLVVLVLALAAVVLPPVEGPRDDDAAYSGRRGDLATVVAANGVTYLGTYVLYSYVSILLRDAGAPAGWTGPILLLFGVCGLVGLRVAATGLDRRPHGSAVVIPALMAAGTVAVALAYPRLGLVVVAGMCWLAAFGPAASLYQSASVRTAASAPETAGAWINASSNAGIATGAALGGAVMGAAGLTWMAWTSAGMVAVSAVLALVARSAFEPRETVPGPGSPPTSPYGGRGGKEWDVADRDRNADGRAQQARPRDALGRPLAYGAVGVEPISEEPRPPAETLAYARELLDQGRPFAAHEALEVRWKSCPEPERELWQGLAQLCVGLTHHERGNAVGAARLVERAAGRLAAYARSGGPTYGLDLDAVVGCARERVEEG